MTEDEIADLADYLMEIDLVIKGSPSVLKHERIRKAQMEAREAAKTIYDDALNNGKRPRMRKL